MRKCWLLFALGVSLSTAAQAQIPFEVFAGQERTSLDVMFFRFFNNREGQATRFLFFNRNRAVTDYHNRTAFGSTNAISYNFKSGLGIVAVGQVLGTGFVPKVGVQYAGRFADLTVFSWVVVSTFEKNNDLDWFLLMRYTPKLGETLRLFSQLELVNGFALNGGMNLVQRYRLGLGYHTWQWGLGADFQQRGRTETGLASNHNLGVFLRHEF